MNKEVKMGQFYGGETKTITTRKVLPFLFHLFPLNRMNDTKSDINEAYVI